MTKLIVLGILLLGVAFGLLRFRVDWFEPRLTFFPTPGQQSVPAVPFRAFPVETSDGEKVSAWLLEHPQPLAEVLYFHGNGGNLSSWRDVLEELHRQSLTVFALDYRGYGKSTGRPTERGLYTDAQAFLTLFWKDLHRPHQKVIYWGRSLGGPVAAFATTQRMPDGLILESTFPSKSSLLRHYPLLKVLSLFSRYRFSTTFHLKEIRSPVLVLHGDRDRVVPFEQGQLLFQQIEGEKYFHAIPGGGHNSFPFGAHASYWERISDFIRGIDGE